MSKAFTSEETPDEAVLGRNPARVGRGQERPMTVAGHRALLVEQQRLMEARAAAHDDQRPSIDHRLAVIAATLDSVRVVEPPPRDGVVRFGSIVELHWSDGRRQTVHLVGPDEADGKDKVSIDAPLARTLVELSQGDEVEVERPRGVSVARLVSVR